VLILEKPIRAIELKVAITELIGVPQEVPVTAGVI
jgi:hypothetical protein